MASDGSALRWETGDEETGISVHANRNLSRQISKQRIIDPKLAIPIHHRTLFVSLKVPTDDTLADQSVIALLN